MLKLLLKQLCRSNLTKGNSNVRLPSGSFVPRILNIALSIKLLSMCLTSQTGADDRVAFFEQKVRPVLIEHCYGCHSAKAEKLKGNLFLDSKSGWERGGDFGEPAIVPGDPDASLLIRSIQHAESGLEMPPDRPKLPDSVIADLVAWVKIGAPDPRTDVTMKVKRADKTWWSLQPLRTEFECDSIDGFIQAKLSEKGLSQNLLADPRSLIRRMTYDVTGLPPTPEEVEAFVQEYSEASPNTHPVVEELVDRLLASPRYGEHWGRHWLDVIRFGESNGFERNVVIDDLYPFRDYVIRSINEDKPFDQFIVEHLAGDVIGKDIPEVEIGSAFLVAGPYDDVKNQDIVAQANIRAATIDDMITATASAFLGLTINCARCHNHKFDPIPTEDYYRIRAAFEGVEHGRRAIATKEEREAYAKQTKPFEKDLAELTRQVEAIESAISERAKEFVKTQQPTRSKVDPNGTTEEFSPVQTKFVRFVIHGFTDGYDATGRRLPSSSGKLTEFQVWDIHERNVALAENGTKADGAKSAIAEDFPEAYGPQYCIDGQTGEAWFIGDPPILRLNLAKPETIHRITFINARGERGTDESKVRGATPSEYEVQVSIDGVDWQTVASNEGREPWSSAQTLSEARKSSITVVDEAKLAELQKEIARVKRLLSKAPKLKEVWAGKFSEPKTATFVHQGGDPMKPTKPIVASSLDVLNERTTQYALDENSPEGERRLALAKWIVSPENPLTPRVLANRVWQYHFGIGLVDTPSDFGFLGSQPTHPELLDYLTHKLISNDWKLKALHREILLSATYLQSADYRDVGAKVDASSRMLWKFPPRRLTAEEIRDTMLSVAGKLQLEPMGGLGFRLYKFTQNNVCTYFPLDVHGPETYRRAVYHQNARACVVDVLNDFDLPDIAFAAPKRVNTTTPLQALTLLNHSFTLDMAQALVSRIEAANISDSVTKAYRIVYQREPTTEEASLASSLWLEHGPDAFCRAILNSNELIYLE